MVEMIKKSKNPEKYIEVLSELNPNFAELISNEVNN